MEALQLLALLIAPLKGLQVFGTWMAGSAAENCNFILLNDFHDLAVAERSWTKICALLFR